MENLLNVNGDFILITRCSSVGNKKKLIFTDLIFYFFYLNWMDDILDTRQKRSSAALAAYLNIVTLSLSVFLTVTGCCDICFSCFSTN